MTRQIVAMDQVGDRERGKLGFGTPRDAAEVIVGQHGPFGGVELNDTDEGLVEQRIEGAATRLGYFQRLMSFGDVAEEHRQVRSCGNGVNFIPGIERRKEGLECFARLVGDREPVTFVEDRADRLGEALPEIAADQTAKAQFPNRIFIGEDETPVRVEYDDAIRRVLEKICRGEVQHRCFSSCYRHRCSPTANGLRGQCTDGGCRHRFDPCRLGPMKRHLR